VVEDVVRRVAMADVAVEVAEDEGAAHEAKGAPWWAPRVVAQKIKHHRGRWLRIEVVVGEEDRCGGRGQGCRGNACAGFSENASRVRTGTDVANARRAR